jgi:hypothetical protein
VRLLGFWLKVLAGLVGALGFGLLGFGIETGDLGEDLVMSSLVLMLIAVGLYAAGRHWHESGSPIEYDSTDRSSSRRFRPGKNAGWLPHLAWRDFPDPLPRVPHVLGDPARDIPSGQVPPDENLRRLWLVRAQLAVLLDKKTAKARRQFAGPGTVVVASIGMACSVTMMALRTDPFTGEKWLLAGGFCTAFLVWPFARSLLGCMQGANLVSQRTRALQEEEARLMALDALRPGGPIGGEAVSDAAPYVPPNLAEYRQLPVADEEEPEQFVNPPRRLTLRDLGLALKVLAVATMCGAFFVLGYGIENELYPDFFWAWFAILAAGTVGLATPGYYWHKSKNVLALDIARRPGTLPFEPAEDREWLPHEAWQEFPDPLPDVPDVIGDPLSDIPLGEVPPDDMLRRLWLVRAQLVPYLDKDTVKERSQRFPQMIPGLITVIVGGTGLSAAQDAWAEGDPWFLGTLFAALYLLVQSAWLIYQYLRGFRVVQARREALRQEESKLIGRDQRRPAGPIGGPRLPNFALPPYIPPRVRPDRLL